METDRRAIHVIVISSVLPQPATAGELVLHRHLVDHPEIRLSCFGGEAPQHGIFATLRKFLGKLGQTPFRRFAEDTWPILGGRWLDSSLPSSIDEPTVVVTVAHGDAHLAATRFSQKFQLPLIVFFHDYWPDFCGTHRFIKPLVEKQFRALYKAAGTALCVSEQMRDELGTHPQALVHLPIPQNISPPSPYQIRKEGTPFTIRYSGNVADYGTMLSGLLQPSLDSTKLTLEIRSGGEPQWSPELKAQALESGSLLPFAPREELEAWLESSDAFLITMRFDSNERRRMETSFPSKLLEFAQYGKPLIIWGPASCSAIRWAQQEKKALCITDPDPKVAFAALTKLAENPDECSRLAATASRASQNEFSPTVIQSQFAQALKDAIESNHPKFLEEA